MLSLVRAMAGLTDALADIRAAQQRAHQADAARAAAVLLHTYTPPTPIDGPSLGATSQSPSSPQTMLMPKPATRHRRR
jgi:hypothetical protein